jgi:DNA-directed RNA polymerase specialized sigma24 family protein
MSNVFSVETFQNNPASAGFPPGDPRLPPHPSTSSPYHPRSTIPEESPSFEKTSTDDFSDFSRLLRWIDSDEDKAGMAYETFRRVLIVFFERRRQGDHAHELADRVFNIVSRKLGAGDVLIATNPRAYLLGVARNVWREQYKKPRLEPLCIDEVHGQTRDERNHFSSKQQRTLRDKWDEHSRDQECLRAQRLLLDRLDCCLLKLSEESRNLVLEYYRNDASSNMEGRRNLANRLGLTSNALTIRVHRIRKQLGVLLFALIAEQHAKPLHPRATLRCASGKAA